MSFFCALMALIMSPLRPQCSFLLHLSFNSPAISSCFNSLSFNRAAMGKKRENPACFSVINSPNTIERHLKRHQLSRAAGASYQVYSARVAAVQTCVS